MHEVELWCAECGRYVTYRGELVTSHGAPYWVRVTPRMQDEQHRTAAHGSGGRDGR